MSPKLDRREFLKLSAAGSVSVTLPLLVQSTNQRSKQSRANIVLIMADDLGFSDLGCYGGEIHTPNLNKLAENGLRFTQFYNNAICVATRASLLTGLYSQQVNGGAMSQAITIAEGLKEDGYRTLMTGKWHADGIPVEHGFDRHYGLIDGCCNYFNPGKQRPAEPPPGKKSPGDNQPFAIDDELIQPYTPKDKDYYTTDAFTNYALDYLEEYKEENKPFFLYVAYTAPHYPLHAWPEDIAKYQGKFMKGWDLFREERYQRMTNMGLIKKQWKLSPLDQYSLSWNEIEDKDAWDLKMAVYAAMVDRMDQNIGRILAKLSEIGEEDNTLLLFLSDNGPSDEDRTSTPDIPPGPLESYRTLDLPWANLSNTPFRKFKRWDHEGGIATPLIAYWPKVIRQGGEITHQVGHVIDIMATCLHLANTEYPSSYRGEEIIPLEGKSLLPVLLGKKRGKHKAIYWNMAGHWRAVRQGKWKIVSPDYWRDYNPWRYKEKKEVQPKPPDNPDKIWELYDMENDRTETQNLTKRYPERVEKMIAMYHTWEEKCRS